MISMISMISACSAKLLAGFCLIDDRHIMLSWNILIFFQRAQRWADYMDSLSADRVNLAQLLMKTLDEIEQESGIFLIKPMYSLKGR